MNPHLRNVPGRQGQVTVNKQDCYYYYYSSCSKGASCTFRHEPAARGNETMCVHWLQGKCIKPHCNFKHMELKKNRSKIPCFHESQPGGCLKNHCPFLHVNKDETQLENAPISDSSDMGFEDNKLRFNVSNLKPVPQTDRKNITRNDFNQTGGETKTWITSFMLARAISDYPGFSTTLLTLYETFKFDPTFVKKMASENCAVFALEGETIILRPYIKICQNYLSSEGCDDFVGSSLPCQNLHLCKEFLLGICEKAICSFGHNLDTNQNKSVLDIFKLSLIPSDVLLKLFKIVVFKPSRTKEGLRVCVFYNKGDCQRSNCKSLHLCEKYLAKLCYEKDKRCQLNHDVVGKEVLDILILHGLTSNESVDDIHQLLLTCPLVKKNIDDLVAKEKIANNKLVKTMWSHDYEGNVQVKQICYNSVENFCPNESSGCPKLHSKYHFHWQVLSTLNDEKSWVNLPIDQVIALEKAYCNPALQKVVLPPLDTTILQSSCRNLINLLKGKSKWEANFTKMKLVLIGDSGVIGDNSVLKLRRLRTVNDSNQLPKSSTYAWYFCDKMNGWNEYGNVDSTKDESLKVNINSSIIEKHYKQNPENDLSFSNSHFTYMLNFSTMSQMNTKTNVSRAVRRRPVPHLKGLPGQQNSSMDFPDQWDAMNSGERVKRVKILPTSEEYKKVTLLMQQKGGNYTIENMERVQNPYFWRAFQNKIEEMKALYGNETSVNVQQLFHGTNPDTVSKICEENFDWRLHGSNVGQAYGRGTYFSPLASTSYSYTKPDASGRRYMFVAKVAVGSLTLGNTSMARPPINPQTNLPFDSTVDNQGSPSIIVKYDKQEYTPEYILTLK